MPKELLCADPHFEVACGVDGAFMSTTTNREVALDFTAGSKISVVFELQQGLIDRGAGLSTVSQYPYEKKILFGPLTAMTVTGTRVERSVLVVEARINANLLALTIEQVGSKRRKVVSDMIANVIADFKYSLAKEDAWAKLGPQVQNYALSYLEELLQPLAKEEPEYYNHDAQLGGALERILAEKLHEADCAVAWVLGRARQCTAFLQWHALISGVLSWCRG